MIMPETDQGQAQTGAERIRRAVATEAFGIDGGRKQLNITVSAGVATYAGGDESVSEFMHRADLALYEAKQAGRNQVRTLAA